MFKKYLFIIILLNYFNSYGQNIDSLGKYAYHLYGYTNEYRIINGVKQVRLVTGSCFFIRKKNELFLVSAAHVLTGLNHDNEPKPHYTYPKSFWITLYNKESNKQEDFEFNIEKIEKTFADSFYYKHPDVYAIKITLPAKYLINSVESFIKKKAIKYKDINIAVMYGYPENGNGLEKCLLDINDLNDMQFDENKNVMNIISGIKTGIAGVGDSGCPMFFITKNSKVAFAGLCIALKNDKVVFEASQYVMGTIR